MMSDENLLAINNKRTRLSFDILGLMMKGAGYAALAVIAVSLVIYLIYVIGLHLPAESREAVDPTPLSFEVSPPAQGQARFVV